MGVMEELRDLYDAYIEKALAAERNRKFGEGLFGIGKRPSDDPCHEAFVANLDAFLRRYAAEQPASGEMKEVLSYIYTIPKQYEDPKSLYWMLMAVHGLTVEFADRMTSADAAEMEEAYKKMYPRRERLPVQQKLVRRLEKAALGRR